ncbi:serine kinase [Dyadobacter fanqingshengii]|uniref:Serine kinase n=1 Tax=Dyadobacter fanqingshengii TaxID=2906443 RepID=A0A9X1P707_9BACT|nr:serine kinase [Dyadobacter fanqingshengii]MCF0039521.1 serine kinase [Dyadobacter fanqingshengii]USJ33670.1 serine kinase [Dyadobacter fanqingshengii]
MHHYKAFGLNILSEIELPELSDGDASTRHDLYIQSASFELPALENTQLYRRGVRAGFAKDADENLYLHWNNVASFKASNGNCLVVRPLVDDNNLVSLFTVSEALGLILFQRGLFLLHASAVRVGNEGWCFMGMPGAGKSTTAAAFIKAGCKLLSDDLTAIGFNDNGLAYIVPAYPQLKIWDKTANGLHYEKSELQPVSEGVNKFSYQPKSDFLQEPVPLKEVFFLHKARNRKPLVPLSAAEIPTETLKNFPLPSQLLTEDALKRHFSQSFQCTRSARLWKKKRPDGFENLEKWVSESIAEQLTAG